MDSTKLNSLRARLQELVGVVDELLAALVCTDCGRTARKLLPVVEDGEVVAWLGPTCHQRRMDSEQPRTAVQLPIGDQA